MGFVTLEKSEKKDLFVQKDASVHNLQQALHANAKEQLLLREVINQLKAEGKMQAAENGRQLWLDLKAMHTSLQKLLKEAKREERNR